MLHKILLGPPSKETFDKSKIALYYYAKVNCFRDKEKKNSFIHVNTVSNYLNFALQKVFLS